MPFPDAAVSGSTPAAPVGLSGAEGGAVNQQAVEHARREIQGLVREVAELAKTDIEPAKFYAELLNRVVSALAAEGGAVWTVEDGNRPRLAYQVNLQEAKLINREQQTKHAAVLADCIQSGRDQLVPPNSGTAGDGIENPTRHLLILGVLKTDEGTQGIVEIFQRGDTRPLAQRGYLRFVQQMCELASTYLTNRRLKHFTHKQTLWEQIQQFANEVHRGLDVRRTAFTIANDGRRLIDCDRVSVVLVSGRSCRVEAISGQETVDRRSNVVARLARLAKTVTATGEPLWYTGDASQLAPQVEKAVDAYVDAAHAKMIAVLPLREPADENDKEGKTTVAALVVEQIGDSEPAVGLRQRVEVVAEHSAVALANAVEHQSLFLLPVWKALGRARQLVVGRALPKTAAATAAVATAIVLLAVVPADFALEAPGVLQPTTRRNVFAGIDGVVVEVPAAHGKQVAADEVLARLRNTDLEVQITDLVGRREATAQQIQAIQRALLDESRLSVEEQNRLAGQLHELRQTFDSFGRQLKLYRQKQEQLTVKSEIAGQVVTWQVRQRLTRRPVRQGQILMSVADPAGPWELELHVPEDRMGHVAKAAADQEERLRVTYILATNPGRTYEGRVKEIHTTAEVRGEEGSTVLVTVSIDKRVLEELRPGATVTAKLHCGTRSLGYVWLHDVWAFVHGKILFRL